MNQGKVMYAGAEPGFFVGGGGPYLKTRDQII